MFYLIQWGDCRRSSHLQTVIFWKRCVSMEGSLRSHVVYENLQTIKKLCFISGKLTHLRLRIRVCVRMCPYVASAYDHFLYYISHDIEITFPGRRFKFYQCRYELFQSYKLTARDDILFYRKTKRSPTTYMYATTFVLTFIVIRSRSHVRVI